MSEWQPIDTAPRGEWILLFSHDDLAPRLADSYDVGVQAEDGIFENDEGRLIWSPTHWMPLPDPPEKK